MFFLFSCVFFFFNDTATTEIYTLSLHDALPIYGHTWKGFLGLGVGRNFVYHGFTNPQLPMLSLSPGASSDRKSTRLNSSHPSISYAVFCLKKKKHNNKMMVIKILTNTCWISASI